MFVLEHIGALLHLDWCVMHLDWSTPNRKSLCELKCPEISQTVEDSRQAEAVTID
jgi:hypothetical protein